ncbi:MAG TPA: NUDIX domain-containing protein [Burkholderiaceae bacterium]|nr:NUDIX domain-containing protein [Burkholderiaceae bacterium]
MTDSMHRLDDAWLARLAARLDVPPLLPRVPLAIALNGAPNVAMIGSIESTLALDLVGAGLPLRDAGERWQFELPNAAAIDPVLARAARWLFEHGVVTRWRDERLAVLNERRRPVGAIARSAVRPLGIATHAAHLVVHDGRGGVWVQQRAFDKATDPGMWDTTVGGLVADGESIETALIREAWEEAGLTPLALHGLASFGRFTVRRPLPEGYMVEHIEMFEAAVAPETVPKNRDGEVERFECLSVPELIERLHADAFTLEAAAILARWLARRAPRR